MGKQHNFYANKKDLESFIQLLEKRKVCVIPNDEYPTKKDIKRIKPAAFDFFSLNYNYCFLIPEEISIEKLNLTKHKSCYIIDYVSNNPLIEFSPSLLQEDNKTLNLGRIYIDYTMDDNYQKILTKHFNYLKKYFDEWNRTSKYKRHIGHGIIDEIKSKGLKMFDNDMI